MNMYEWCKVVPTSGKTMPILSFPGIQLMNVPVDQLVRDGALQAQCMQVIHDRYDSLASVSLMDLSVEAEAFGSPIRFSEDEVPTVLSAIVPDHEAAEKLVVPPVGAGRTCEALKGMALASQSIKDRPVFAGMIGPFSLAGRLMDMTEIMIKCYEEPEDAHLVLEKATAFLIEYAKAFRDTGCQGVVIAEPAAGLLSPDLISEFSSPYVRRILEAVEREDFLFIYHNCGNTMRLTDSLLSINARAYHFGNVIDLAKMLPKIPEDRLVMGNVDPVSQFRNGTPESVRAATFALMRACSKYPHFSVSSGCDIPPLTPLENIDAYFKAVADFHSGVAE